jgi:hypothetical protein
MIKCTFMPTFLNNEQNQIMYSQATQLYATLAFTIRLRVRRSQDYGHGLSHRISCRDNETQTTRNDEKRKIKKETLENTKNHTVHHKKRPTCHFSATFSQSIRERQ